MQISKHAKKRLKERCGFNKKSQDRMAQKAFKDGITHSQTKGKLNKWITSLYFKNKKANNIRIYGDKAYIFCNEILVTVIQVPADLRKNLKDMIREELSE
ncbi:MAG: hypothetical protein K2N51_11980 [Lachnospiraceae bacterium]|nr:hypothetical protein [Lachnospiraceae bacterium]